MPMTLSITANDAAGSSYTFLAGSGTDVWKLKTANWGNAVWETAYSGPRGTLGSVPTSAVPSNRPVQLGFTLLPSAATDAPGHLADVSLVVDRVRKYGGRVTVKTSIASYRQHFEVFAGSASLADWTNRAEHRGRLDIALQFVCGPYVLGDTMHVVDRFTSDTESDYTFDTGSGANVTVGSGQFKSTATAAIHAAIHTATGYRYGDHQATVRSVVTTVTNHGSGVILKRTASGGNFILVYVEDNGVNSVLTIEEVRSNSGNVLATQNLSSRISAGVPFWVVGRIEGNTVYAEHWTSPPTLGGTATTVTSTTLTGTPLTTFGEGTTGQAGVYLYPASASDYVEFFEVRPYVYRGSNFTGYQHPDNFRLDGAIVGDAPALAEVEVAGAGISGDYTRFGMVGWSRRAEVHNMVQDGGFEQGLSTHIGRAWSVAAVSGVTGAATSQTRTSGGRFGSYCNQIVCPATANTGVSCRIDRRFRAGVTYTAELYARAASATTNTRIRLGVSGDIGSETATALSTSWVKRTVTWTPTATVDVAYVAFEITAATATTMQIDGVSVYEGTTAPAGIAQQGGLGGRPPFGIVSAAEASYLTNCTLTTGGSTTDYWKGKYITGAASPGYAVWVVDPNLIPRDDLSADLDVEVWALGTFQNTTYKAGAWQLPIDAWGLSSKTTGVTYTREYGSTGYATGAATYGWLRLGTLPLSPESSAPYQRLDPLVCIAVGVGSGSWSSTVITCIALVPARARVLSPTGKTDDADYPRFSVNTDSFRRKFRPDGSGLMQLSTGTWRTAPGLGGSTIEIDPGATDVITAAARYIPGTTSSSITTYPQTGAVAITPTPRWHQIRDE